MVIALTRQVLLLGCALWAFSALGRMADAAPITFASGGGTYTYDTATPTGADANAVISANVGWTHETNPGYDTYYFVPVGQVGTVAYTFDAAAGEHFVSGSALEHFNLFFADSNSSITGSLTTDLNATPVVFNSLVGDASVNSGIASTYNSDVLPIAGASTFTITYTITNQTGNDIFLQLGREDNADANSFNGAGTFPFVISAVSAVPEPSTFALLGLGALGLLIAARRRK